MARTYFRPRGPNPWISHQGVEYQAGDDGWVTVDDDAVAAIFRDGGYVEKGAMLSASAAAAVQALRIPGPVGLIGDSRMAAGYDYWTPSAASLSGSTLTLVAATGTVSAQGLGTLQVGETIICSLCTGVDYIRATVATSDGTTGITATVNYPKQLPSGNVLSGNSRVFAVGSKPLTISSAFSALMALRGFPLDDIRSYAFIGATLQQMITYQADDAIAQGCSAVVLLGSVNDYLTTGGNKSSSYCIQKIAELWSRLSNRTIYHLLESPLSGSYATPTNKQRAADVTAWMQANAASYGVILLDQRTPMTDPSTGDFKTGYSADGLHPSLAACLNAGIYLNSQNIPFMPASRWISSALGQATQAQPALNPTMQGVVGAGNIATSYSTNLTGGVTIVSRELAALDNGNQEQRFVLAASAAGSMLLNCGTMTVVAGGKYRMRGRIRVADATGFQGFDIKLFNVTGSVLIRFAQGQSAVVASGGANGSYTLTYDQIITIPAGVTSAYMQARQWFDAAGGGTFGFSDMEFLPAP